MQLGIASRAPIPRSRRRRRQPHSRRADRSIRAFIANRPAVASMIAKALITRKSLRVYSTRTLRRKKSLRNNADELRRQMLSDATWAQITPRARSAQRQEE